jgi:PilZ domain
MSTNPWEPLTAYTGAGKASGAAMAYPSERRKRPRTRVHWQVLLFRNQVAEAITSTTVDLSSSGFYCIAAVPFVPGEVLICALKIPSHDPNGKHLERNLECKVRVIRVQSEAADNSSFGVACLIEDYRFTDL